MKKKKRKKTGGRQLLLTKERHDLIISTIADGNYECVAWMIGGISETTYYHWKDRGQFEDSEKVPQKDRIYWEFAEAIKAAIAESEASAVRYVKSQMPNNWQCAMTFMERKFPERWGKKDRLTIEAHIMAGDVVREIAAAIDERAPEIKEKFDAVMEWMGRNK